MRWFPGRSPAALSLFFLLLVPVAPARGQTPSRIVIDVPGSGIAARLGQMVAAAGDLNGDGRPDFAVASPGWGPTTSDSTGRVLIWFGGRDLSAAPDRILTGFRRGAQFGYAVCGIGDVNGDGFDDLLVTAPGFERGDVSRFGSGRGYVYFGGAAFDDLPDRILDPVNFQGYGFARQLGSSAAGLGDTDGDGFPDWAIGFDNSQTIVRGGAYVYHGGVTPASVPVILAKNNGGQRPVVAAAGDFDGDGLADLAIGAPFSSGTAIVTTVSIFAGLVGSGGADPIGTASVSAVGFGAALAAADVNGDGLSDVLVGQPLAGGASQVRLILGTRVHNFGLIAEPFLFPSGGAPDSFGCSLAVGKADGTGDLDLLVGASGDRSGGAGAGAVYLYRLQERFGVPVPLTILVTTIPGSPGDALGARVAVPGDVDGNGIDDLLVGAPQRAASGNARVFTLAALTLLAPHSGEWPAGGAADVTWRGRAAAHLDLSLDDGATWRTLADGAGGLDVNTLTVEVPDTVSGGCRVRLFQSGGPVDLLHSDRSDATFSIVRPARAFPSAAEGAPVRAPSADDGRLGAALSGGDFGLGVPAIAIGSPLADGAGPNSGRVFVQASDAPARALRLEGEAGGERFGAAVALGGDVDGDGRGDLLAGAPDRSGPDGRAGGVSLFAAGATTPAWRAWGSQDGESFGAAVAWVGDVDRDGRAEFAVGSPWFAPLSPRHGTGRVQVFRGGMPPAKLLTLDAPSGVTQFGRALAGLDLDGDGRGDLVVSGVDADGSGAVMVWFGASLDTTPDLVLRAGSGNGDDRFGEAIAPAGDLNGDGFADLLVGSPGRGGTGRVFVVNGGPHPAPAFAHEFAGVEAGEDFGAALAGAGDLDGDGRDDFVAGAPLANGGRGAVRVFLGGSDGVARCMEGGAAPGERFGAALARGSDHAFFAAAPFDDRLGGGASGRVDRVSVTRYVVDSPRPGARWFTGCAGAIVWRGGEPADVALSLDAGRTWTPLASHAVADPAHPLLVTAPSVVTDSALVRVRPSDPSVPGEVLRSFAITRATEVRRFDFTLETGGIRLTWDTAPGIGPQGWSAYRIERDGDPPSPVGPARIEESELLVPDFTRGATYVLLGIDGNGAATELARTTVPAPATRLAAWPVPSASGDVQLSVFPPVDAAGRSPADFVVRVFDLHGRLVGAIASGRIATRAGELRLAWNRRGVRGEVAGPGLYFVRAEAPGEGFHLARRVVLLH